jgi:hypothetical protein
MAWLDRVEVRSLALLGSVLVGGAAWGADGAGRAAATRPPAAAPVLAAGARSVAGGPGARTTLRSLAPARATPGVAPSSCIPAWAIDASGIRRLPDRCPDESPASGASALAAADALSAAAAPERPLVSNAGGVVSSAAAPGSAKAKAKRRPARAAGATARCEQPYWTDARGVRRLRPACM